MPLLKAGFRIAQSRRSSALSDMTLARRIVATADEGDLALALLSGAIGGVDALAAAKLGGLDESVVHGRKPPTGWLRYARGTGLRSERVESRAGDLRRQRARSGASPIRRAPALPRRLRSLVSVSITRPFA